MAREFIVASRGGVEEPLYEIDTSNPWQVRLSDAGKEAIRNLSPELRADEALVVQALRAHLLFQRDREYVLDGGRVVILDNQTGRPTPGRRYSDGLHQQLEIKEGVDVTGEPLPEGSLRIQEYFRSYGKLAGMTGTARQQAEEFKARYRMDVGVVPTGQPVNRIDHEDRVCTSPAARDTAVLEEGAPLQPRP